ncbi:hypothetical protein [Naasia sp. SYSU D00948]|uniref:hypothetical protein n=1 Tax=Naasia sp. SYSU D00948 TaxID=2817379 RepID=UPI001B313703|nr:hypothetical protein [Naasia sp. SYSU D00948]
MAVAAIVALSIAARGSAKRTGRGSGSVGAGMIGAVDEVFAPGRYEAMLEQERQTALPAPAPVAGDDDKGIFEGRISIRVPGDD